MSENISMNKLQFQDEMLDTIELMVSKYVGNSFKNCEFGVISTVNIDGTYTVTRNGETFNLTSASETTFIGNEPVVIFIPNGNYSQRFILCKKPN